METKMLEGTQKKPALKYRVLIFFLQNRALLLVLLFFILLSLTTNTFLTSRNLMSLSRQIAANGIIGVGYTFLLASDSVDLSAGYLMCMIGIVSGLLIQIKIRGGVLILNKTNLQAGVQLFCPGLQNHAPGSPVLNHAIGSFFDRSKEGGVRGYIGQCQHRIFAVCNRQLSINTVQRIFSNGVRRESRGKAAGEKKNRQNQRQISTQGGHRPFNNVSVP